MCCEGYFLQVIKQATDVLFEVYWPILTGQSEFCTPTLAYQLVGILSFSVVRSSMVIIINTVSQNRNIGLSLPLSLSVSLMSYHLLQIYLATNSLDNSINQPNYLCQSQNGWVLPKMCKWASECAVCVVWIVQACTPRKPTLHELINWIQTQSNYRVCDYHYATNLVMALKTENKLPQVE